MSPPPAQDARDARPVLVTGAAGFIGMHVCAALLEQGVRVVGVDNLSPYTDVQLKRDRLATLAPHPGFRFERLDLSEPGPTAALFAGLRPRVVVHLAAQVGVRHSLEAPDDYVRANVAAFTQVLEGCRRVGVEHLVYASSSSVYGLNTRIPFDEAQPVDHPISLYAATKRANELMAHTWSHLYALPTTGLRFFTVYGPWGRPDMALFGFTRAMLAGEPIRLFNQGEMSRDFTYVGDVVRSVLALLDRPPVGDPARAPEGPQHSPAPYRVLNVGRSQPVGLLEFVRALERALGCEARLEGLPMQPGDLPSTWADCGALEALTGQAPRTPLEDGVRRFVLWYRAYYAV